MNVFNDLSDNFAIQTVNATLLGKGHVVGRDHVAHYASYRACNAHNARLWFYE